MVLRYRHFKGAAKPSLRGALPNVCPCLDYYLLLSTQGLVFFVSFASCFIAAAFLFPAFELRRLQLRATCTTSCRYSVAVARDACQSARESRTKVFWDMHLHERAPCSERHSVNLESSSEGFTKSITIPSVCIRRVDSAALFKGSYIRCKVEAKCPIEDKANGQCLLLALCTARNHSSCGVSKSG